MLRLIAIELILFCALFTMMVKTAVWNSALNGLYFYPEPVQERAFDIGLTDRDSGITTNNCRNWLSVGIADSLAV